jgi:hypothetical protein
MTQRNPSLLSPAEYALLLEAKEFRNRIEHYDFEGTEDRLRTVCTDFLEICMLLAETLLSVNIAEGRHRKIFARDPQDLIRGEDRGAFQHVLQFAHIPQPWIPDKRVHRFGRDRVDGLSEAGAELLHVVANQ